MAIKLLVSFYAIDKRGGGGGGEVVFGQKENFRQTYE